MTTLDDITSVPMNLEVIHYVRERVEPPPGVATPQDLSGIVGRHFIYTYANGWQYEMYVKNASTIDYRIHSGMVRGRWVKDQRVYLVRLGEDSYKIAWTEPTGTCVVVNVMLGRRLYHGVAFFPQWIPQHPERTMLFQNDHLDEMAQHRETGPTYPLFVVSEFATITFLKDMGPDDETVIDRAPADLPAGYADRIN